LSAHEPLPELHLRLSLPATAPSGYRCEVRLIDTGGTVFSVLALLAGAGLLVIYWRGLLLRRLLKARGVKVTGKVVSASKTEAGANSSNLVSYEDQHGNRHMKVVASSGSRGDEVIVWFDPDAPKRAVVVGSHGHMLALLFGVLLSLPGAIGVGLAIYQSIAG